MMGHDRIMCLHKEKTTPNMMLKDFKLMVNQRETFNYLQNVLVWHLGKDGENETLQYFGFTIFEATGSKKYPKDENLKWFYKKEEN